MSAAERTYWRTLEELADSPEFAAAVERETPRFQPMLGALDRRRFLQLMAASLALGGLSACGPEPEPRQLLPYVKQPASFPDARAITHRRQRCGLWLWLWLWRADLPPDGAAGQG